MGIVFVPMSLLSDDMLDKVVELSDKQKVKLFSVLLKDGGFNSSSQILDKVKKEEE